MSEFFYWSRDGKKWTWTLAAEPKCSDLKIPMPLEDFRGETAEQRKAREAHERAVAIVEKNRKATTEEDIKNFKAGDLDKIKVGTGKGNSMADLKLNYQGWILGRWIAEGRIKSNGEIAAWVRRTIGRAAP